MKPARSIDINLLPQDAFYGSLSGRVLLWALSAGRYLLIFTLLILIVSFASRFSLDRQVTDLNSKIFQQFSLIKSYGTLEKDFKQAQAKIQAYSELSNQKNLTEVFADLSKITPPEVTIEKLTVSPDKILVSGSAPSQEIFSTLITNLQLSPEFSDVTVSKVEANSATTGYSFQFTAQTTKSNTTPRNPAVSPSPTNL